MPKKVKSARGATVDFDLMKIKEQISSDPAPLDVKARQDHIDSRMRRRMRNIKKTPLSTTPLQKPTAAPAAPAATKAPVEVDAESPQINETPVEFIDDVEDNIDEDTNTTPTTNSRQKARRKPTTKDE